MQRDFTRDSDETLIRYWNDRDGGLSWMLAIEDELTHRGYKTRDAEGHMAQLFTIQSDHNSRDHAA